MRRCFKPPSAVNNDKSKGDPDSGGVLARCLPGHQVKRYEVASHFFVPSKNAWRHGQWWR